MTVARLTLVLAALSMTLAATPAAALAAGPIKQAKKALKSACNAVEDDVRTTLELERKLVFAAIGTLEAQLAEA